MPIRPALTRLLIAAMAVAAPVSFASAQDRAGRDTPGEWKVTHFKPFGLWDSICDERRTGETLEQRCYVRYVDVYSPQPQFGAAFAFIVPDGRGSGVTAEFGFERGIRFADDGFRIVSGGNTIWTHDPAPCARGGTCDFDSREMAAIEALLADADEPAFVLAFTGRHGKDRELRWGSAKLDEAIADMRTRARERSLID